MYMRGFQIFHENKYCFLYLINMKIKLHLRPPMQKAWERHVVYLPSLDGFCFYLKPSHPETTKGRLSDKLKFEEEKIDIDNDC